MASPGLQVLQRTENAVVVELHEERLLEGIADLRWHLDRFVTDGVPTLTIDLSGVPKVSSVTVAALLWARRYCHARGRRVTLRDPSHATVKVFLRTGMWDVFEVEPAQATRTGRVL